MGYTHYWSRPEEIPARYFHAIRADFEKLILPLSDLGVHLAGPQGDDVPILAQNLIAFNGLHACGHPVDEDIVIPYPSEFAQGLGSSHNAIDGSFYGVGVTLKHRCCGGSCRCESFHLARIKQIHPGETPDEQGFFGEGTKTAFRPYDIAVTAALLIAKRHLHDSLTINSCGTESQWLDAKRLCQRILGYGDWFGIVEEEIEEACPGPNDKRRVLLRSLVGTAGPVAG